MFSLRGEITELSSQFQDEARQIRLDSLGSQIGVSSQSDGFDVEEWNILLSRFQMELDEKVVSRRCFVEREADEISEMLREERIKLAEEDKGREHSSEERKKEMTVSYLKLFLIHIIGYLG